MVIKPSFATRRLAFFFAVLFIFVLSYLSFRDDSPGAGYLNAVPVPKPVLVPEPSPMPESSPVTKPSSAPESSSVPEPSPVPESSPVTRPTPVVEQQEPSDETPATLAVPSANILPVPSGSIRLCGNETHAEARRLWLEAEARYSNLTNDKFTIVMPTYRRPDILNTTLSMIANATMPSLHEVVIIWQDLNSTVPEDFTSPSGIPFRFHKPERNSMNNRFLPLESYATQAILHSDDDISYDPADIEFTFQAWRQHGRYRITGPFPRCHGRNPKDNNLFYAQCRPWYSMILTGMAFVHISIMDFYSSSHPIPTSIREHVDDIFNCEDLAMNFLASMITCDGPLHVNGQKKYVFLESKTNGTEAGGISKKPNHWGNRGRCMAHFEETIGFFPLVEQTGSIQRGVSLFW
ncbi:glycosyl transferase family 64 domain-containing protein [Rhypophila decipiens]|uniref:Glycosyl transferase family 64 domain-containing protein n=1 Tax=Rhypophila decipiens TaxID=261697 RepID=A0AAN6Y0E7_9PEZI|nr:glycosyl transferase family 64 domain-containing protein [Rhypophila decipiens]